MEANDFFGEVEICWKGRGRSPVVSPRFSHGQHLKLYGNTMENQGAPHGNKGKPVEVDLSNAKDQFML